MFVYPPIGYVQLLQSVEVLQNESTVEVVIAWLQCHILTQPVGKSESHDSHMTTHNEIILTPTKDCTRRYNKQQSI